MVNRNRSETWTFGTKNEQVKKNLPSFSSETTLKFYSSRDTGIKSNDNLNHNPKKTVTYNDSSLLDDDDSLHQRPVFSTSSMESVDLADLKEFIDNTDSSSGFSLEPDFTSSSTNIDSENCLSVQFEEQNGEKITDSPSSEKQQKSGLNSLFSW